MQQQAILIIGPGKRIPVTVAETDAGTLVIRQGHKILFGLKPVAEFDASEPLASTKPAQRLNPSTPNWDWLTPAMVVEYFRRSNVLYRLADEVESVLKSDIESGDHGPAQLDLDLEAVRPDLDKIIQDGQFTYGHQSRIAEALSIPNQGSYRRRIQNVVKALAEEFGLKRAA